MALGGYANHVARVDLSSGSVAYEGINEEDARLYIGARGLGVKYVYDNDPATDPNSPDNLLGLVNGPLTGTEATMSGRLAFVTKSPLTGTVVDSHMGGWSAARLRWAGFDALLFTGKSEAPVYAYVEGGTVELRPAGDLWGKGVHETIAILNERYGDNLSVMAIGQAGENGVLFASFMNEDDRAAGRGGTGAVGGMKNLKAVVVKGDRSTMPKAEDRDKWREAHRVALKTIIDSEVTGPKTGGLSVYGTNVLTNVVNAMGGMGTKNSQLTTFEGAEKLSGETVRETILVDEPTCHACPVACKKEVEITEGPYKGLRMESFEYEPAWSLGANCGNDDAGVVAKVIDQCNDHGMDAIEIGNVISMYMEASEKGYVPGPGLAWGDGAGMVKLAEQMAMREGPGEILGLGTAKAAEAYGHPEIAMAVKGQAVPAYDPRAIKGEGIGYATSNRGACHLRGYTPASEILGIPVKTDPLAWEGKGALLKIFQDLHAFSDSLDLCKFSAFAEGAAEYAQQYEAIVGIAISEEDVMTTGERIYNLERRFNNLAGFDGSDDSLPERFLKEPGTGPAANSVCELDEMKAEYYEARGWEDGVVPDAKLQELSIS
ncbi:MAG: aldehyde ferredoxin oxidoreductase family protein [Chloroflexota bacterium]|nr:aldehyde ferredoxin oxidoreductase family protein [Chloroflexota bacterium]